MSNSNFYNRLIKEPKSITWKEILSECKIKHSQRSLERALQVGTSLDTATEADMLQKWRKPWIFFPIAKIGLSIVALLYLAIFMAMYFGGVSNSLMTMMTIIPPLVMPLIILIFLWEMNIPRNISFYELLGYFLVGGVLSFFVNSIMLTIIRVDAAPFAAFREEPAKLLASIAIIYFVSKKKKMYGITGLVIGAAVGAGFGGFESVSYAMSVSGNIAGVMVNQIMRGIYSFGGHTVMAALYMSAFALTMKNSKVTKECILNKEFLGLFACSTMLHFLWNWTMTNSMVFETAKSIAIIVVYWVLLLDMMRKCLRQVVMIGSSGYQNRVAENGNGIGKERITVQCIQGPIRGAVWCSRERETLLIGREVPTGFKIPGNVRGISRNHCSIQQSARGWTVKDLNSSYGTYLNDTKLRVGEEYVLHTGDTVSLAGKECVFKIVIQ